MKDQAKRVSLKPQKGANLPVNRNQIRPSKRVRGVRNGTKGVANSLRARARISGSPGSKLREASSSRRARNGVLLATGTGTGGLGKRVEERWDEIA